MAESGPNPGPTAEIQDKIRKKFIMFSDGSRVDVNDIGDIMYLVGSYPSEAEILKIITKMDEDHSGFVKLDKFMPFMTEVLLENRFPRTPVDRILKAFEVLDKDKKGYLEEEELRKLMTEEGDDPLTPFEFQEMLKALVDPEDGVIDYKKKIKRYAHNY